MGDGRSLLRVGQGFKNKVHNRRGRVAYHTMLPGEISQVRYYMCRLSEAENTCLRESPEEAMPEDLRVHLRFEDGDLALYGTHTTEWVRCEELPERLDYHAHIPEGSEITVCTQFSENGETVSAECDFTVQNGENTLSLDGKRARWVRLRSRFRSVLGEKQSAIPVLHEYALKAGRIYLWNTLDSWQRGTFKGAVGHQDGDVYRNHADDL